MEKDDEEREEMLNEMRWRKWEMKVGRKRN